MDGSTEQRRTTLIVDGSASSIFYTAALLRYLKYTVRTATSGENALQMIAYTAPSVVITEAVLPKMSGVTLLEQIKNSPNLQFIPVIINTSDKQDETREKCTKAGCAGYFIKPAEPEQLFRTIQTVSEKTPRKHIRIKTALKARIETKIEEVTMLSEGGLFVQTPAPLPVNTEVSLTLMVNSREVPARAIVLYGSDKIEGPHAVRGMGMRFTQIRDTDIDVIRTFIKEKVVRDLQG